MKEFYEQLTSMSLFVGVYECECLPDYDGDPLVECHPDDACPYPMPDTLPASPNMGKLQAPLHVNSLHVNTVVIDPNRPTSTLWIDVSRQL